MARLKEKYTAEVAPALMKQFGYKSVMQIPRIDKVVVNVGCGEARENAKVLDNVVGDLGKITGQKAVVTRARKSIANFKLREEMPIGAKVTLRGDKMWEFLDRLFNVALPRVRDFQGINMVTCHVKPRKQGEEGGIVKREAAIAACKVQVVCPKCNKGTRVAHKIEGDKKIRVCKHCGAEL